MKKEQVSGLRRAVSDAIRTARMRISVFAMSTPCTTTFFLKAMTCSIRTAYGNRDERLAPVVSLGSGIQVKSGSGTTSDPYEIGK